MSTILYLSVVKAAFEPFQCVAKVVAPIEEIHKLVDAIVLLNRTKGNFAGNVHGGQIGLF